MKHKMPYWLYKKCYAQFPGDGYDSVKKTIVVDLPEQPRRLVPKNWTKCGNSYYTPGGSRITFWSSGLARNYLVEWGYKRISTRRSATIPAGINSFEQMLEAVQNFEKQRGT